MKIANTRDIQDTELSITPKFVENASGLTGVARFGSQDLQDRTLRLFIPKEAVFDVTDSTVGYGEITHNLGYRPQPFGAFSIDGVKWQQFGDFPPNASDYVWVEDITTEIIKMGWVFYFSTITQIHIKIYLTNYDAI